MFDSSATLWNIIIFCSYSEPKPTGDHLRNGGWINGNLLLLLEGKVSSLSLCASTIIQLPFPVSVFSTLYQLPQAPVNVHLLYFWAHCMVTVCLAVCVLLDYLQFEGSDSVCPKQQSAKKKQVLVVVIQQFSQYEITVVLRGIIQKLRTWVLESEYQGSNPSFVTCQLNGLG